MTHSDKRFLAAIALLVLSILFSLSLWRQAYDNQLSDLLKANHDLRPHSADDVAAMERAGADEVATTR